MKMTRSFTLSAKDLLNEPDLTNMAILDQHHSGKFVFHTFKTSVNVSYSGIYISTYNDYIINILIGACEPTIKIPLS